MQTQIKNIIFDIGRVIVGYQESEVIKATLPHSSHHEFYLKHFLTAQIWQDLDRGTKTIADAIADLSLLKDAPSTLEADLNTISSTFVGTLELFKDSQTLFETLATRYPIYILSNFQDAPFEQLLKLYPFLNVAKGMVVSAKVKMMKPDFEIYQHLLQNFSLKAEECLFLDDKIENIEAAKKQGLHGIVFKNAAQAQIEMQNYGVKI